MRLKHPETILGDLGIDYACALAPCGETEEGSAAEFADWVEEGNHAGMDYLERHVALRRHTDHVLPGARTILTLAFPFPLGEKAGGIAAYALGNDYHDELRTLLRPAIERMRRQYGGEWRICVDSAPVAERHWALRAGLGEATRSGMLYVKGLGTACFLCEILTTASLPFTSEESEESEEESEEEEREKRGEKWRFACAECRRCEEACPGEALRDGLIDARRCLSYLTIEHRGPWEEEMLRVMATPAGRATLFGCDRCVRVCPLNAGRSGLRILPHLQPRPEIAATTPGEVLMMDEDSFRLRFRRSPLRRARLEGLVRNARGVEKGKNGFAGG